MKKSKVHKLPFAFACILNLLCLCANAQQHFRYKATLDSVAQDGVYTIKLTPAMVAECGRQLSDIRIKNDAGKEMPYILKQQTTSSTAINIILFPIIKATATGKIILQNSKDTGINQLLLFIKNTDASRVVTLSGSDDTSHWFVVKEDIVLARDNDENEETYFTQTVHFPYTSYRYFQISMQGKDALPLNIFKAGAYRTTNTINSQVDRLPRPTIIQRDSSDKKSYIKLQWDKNYQISQLRFAFTGAKFFNRSFGLYNGNSTNDVLLASGNITSKDSNATINLQVKTSTLLFVINNFDNAPLLLSRLAAYQLPVSLITYLNGGDSYTLYFGDAALPAPEYDLQYFSDSMQANGKQLAIKKIEELSSSAAGVKNSNYLSGWLLWSIIIAVLILLIYFSFALLKDINRKNNSTDAHL